jgi:hypothetical protein
MVDHRTFSDRERAVPNNMIGTLPRRGLRRSEAAAYIGVGTTKFDELVQRGLMPEGIKIDGVRLFDIRDLDQSFDRLKSSSDCHNPFDEIVA